ncbi:subtilisin-like protein [Auricularia subglabra TFB-10046 SS5]|uniref:Subtilisin-like protein n=1 Tax=Auricularia subglabra (strain TFB-10046 / SS5) TaxID=717982 RepID=J0WXP8_AURST|nr:subtilisin-like protein [Auricularia subglabra TFB-10046 SS5]
MLRSVAATVLSVGTVLAAVKTSEFRELVRKNDATIPGAFIVELSSPPTKRTADAHADFLGELDKRASGKFSTRRKYSSPLFNGIAVQLQNPEASDLASLESIPNVIAVRPIQIFHAPETINRRILSGPDDPNAVPFGQSTHYMTGVDHVHEQGIAGKGIKIGIIDTGIDYLHPNLGGAFGPGNKVAGGYDFVGDAFDGNSPPVPDNDPRDTCIGHGTHVAGIIGANPGNAYNISGVAYEATLLAYRVFSCFGLTTDEILTDAMLRAYSDGADIITMSLGGTDGWASSTLSVLASRIADRGRVMTISAGNDGDAGAVFTSSPATGESVISVASVQNIITTRPALTSSVEHAPVLYENADGFAMPGQVLPIGESPIPVRSLTSDPDADDTACDPINEDFSQVAIVLRQSSSCGLFTQLLNLVATNPKLVIVYDGSPFLLGGFFPAVYLLNKEDGEFLVSEAAKANTTVTFSQNNLSDVPNNDDGGLVSFFSSYGPSNELLFKPAVAAPGGNITSTWPVDLGSFAVDSGTSMSCPYVAGAAALLLQVKGKSAAKNVRSILQTTSRPVPASREKGAPPQTLAQSGAGLVNVFNAINVHTEVSPAELRLNDTAHWNGLHKITIKNTGKTAQTYTLSHVPANTLIGLDDAKINYRYRPDIKQVNAPAGVRLSQSRITIPAGRTATVLATITAPKNVDVKTLPIVSGWISVTGSLGDSVKVSYMGVAGALRDTQGISTGNRMLVEANGGLPAIIPLDQEFLYAQRGPRNYTRDDLPVFVYLMAQGSRHVTLDLIDAATNISSTIPDPLDSAPSHDKRDFDWSWWWPGDKSAAPPAVPTVGTVAEWRDVTRGSPVQRGRPFVVLDFPTQFANGTAVPDGQYKLLLRALRLTGNPKKASDWDVYVSQQVGLVEE